MFNINCNVLQLTIVSSWQVAPGSAWFAVDWWWIFIDWERCFSFIQQYILFVNWKALEIYTACYAMSKNTFASLCVCKCTCICKCTQISEWWVGVDMNYKLVQVIYYFLSFSVRHHKGSFHMHSLIFDVETSNRRC